VPRWPPTRADRRPTSKRTGSEFGQAAAAEWKEVFSDTCTGDWKKQWFLDGEIGTVDTGPRA
jgi:hypothetical protein